MTEEEERCWFLHLLGASSTCSDAAFRTCPASSPRASENTKGAATPQPRGPKAAAPSGTLTKALLVQVLEAPSWCCSRRYIAHMYEGTTRGRRASRGALDKPEEEPDVREDGGGDQCSLMRLILSSLNT